MHVKAGKRNIHTAYEDCKKDKKGIIELLHKALFYNILKEIK